MNPFILIVSVVINITLFLMYLFVMFVLPSAAIALVLYAIARGALLLIRKVRRSKSEGVDRRG